MTSIKINNKTRQKLKNEITEIMVNQAGMKKPIYYGDFCRKISIVNLNPNDQLLHDILGELSKESVNADKGMLSVFAIRKDTGMPRNVFFSLAKELGYSIGSLHSEYGYLAIFCLTEMADDFFKSNMPIKYPIYNPISDKVEKIVSIDPLPKLPRGDLFNLLLNEVVTAKNKFQKLFGRKTNQI